MTTNAQSLPSVIAGDWFERGPSNEAGDVRRVDYDPDSLYVMSVAGHIQKGSLNGNDWSVLNDKITFKSTILKHVKVNNTSRLIACYGADVNNKVPRCSDDQGKTWTLSATDIDDV